MVSNKIFRSVRQPMSRTYSAATGGREAAAPTPISSVSQLAPHARHRQRWSPLASLSVTRRTESTAETTTSAGDWVESMKTLVTF
jgi:hypothetical protein